MHFALKRVSAIHSPRASVSNTNVNIFSLFSSSLSKSRHARLNWSNVLISEQNKRKFSSVSVLSFVCVCKLDKGFLDANERDAMLLSLLNLSMSSRSSLRVSSSSFFSSSSSTEEFFPQRLKALVHSSLFIGFKCAYRESFCHSSYEMCGFLCNKSFFARFE